MSSRTIATAVRFPSALASAAIAAGATLVVCLPFAPGVVGILGLLLAAGTVLLAGIAAWLVAPQAMVALVPTLIPSPMFLLTFAWELALVVLSAALLLHGWRRRSPWLWRLSRVEAALLAFTAWALFSGAWSHDARVYVIAVRRLLLGLGTLWVASRLPHVATRRWFELGLVGGAGALSLSAIVRSLTSGLSEAQALIHRPEVTNLGWGTANYVATLLLLFTPSLLHLSLRGARPLRAPAWIALGLVAAAQLIIASRAATFLFVVGILVQLLRATRRHRGWVGLGSAVAILGVLLSPLGYGLQSRLGSLRELGSLTIRVWYFREGWRRLVEFLPWGMGLGQGYVNADHLQGIDPHNYWLLLGGDLGVVGVVLWAVVMLELVRRWRRTGFDESSRVLSHAMLLTLALANLHTLVEPTFQGGQYQLVFFWILGGTLAYAEVERSAPRPEGEPARPRTFPVPEPGLAGPTPSGA